MKRRRKGGPPGGSYYAVGALLEVRARFHLAYRLATRFLQIASADGGARTGAWKLALAAFVVLDIGLWRALRNPDRFGLKARLLLDSADISFWSLAPYPNGGTYVLAVLVGFPLALEAGVRRGLFGLVVPGVTMATTLLVRSIAGRAGMAEPFLLVFVAVGWGLLLRRYIARLQQDAEAEWARRSSAEHRLAFLAGQNSVAMGASSAVDAIESVLPLLGRPEPGSVMWDVANSWKSALYQSTVGHAVYLGQVLSEWAAEHNSHPDLASRVEVQAQEGAGTTLLTSTQEAALRSQLTRLGLRGRIAVELGKHAATDRPPGGPLSLKIGAHLIEVPPDPERPPRRVDPGPAMFVLASALMLADVLGFPLKLLTVLPAMCLALGAAWWAHIRLQRLGTAAWPAIMWLAVMVAVVYAISATLALKHPLNEAGVENYPIVVGLDLLAILGAMYWDGLRRGSRAATVAGAISVMALGWLLHPIGNDVAHLILQGVWPVALVITVLPLRRALKAAAEAYARRLMDDDIEAEQAAFDSGQVAVIDLVRRARDEAYERLAVVGASLAPALVQNVQQRLEEVDRRLARVTPLGGSSSWTTMS